jgi:acyl-CoA synthetase (AMP-forming)/AMP-acid ligase II
MQEFSKVLGNRVRVIVTGGAQTSPKVLYFLRECFRVMVSDGYGATEVRGRAGRQRERDRERQRDRERDAVFPEGMLSHHGQRQLRRRRGKRTRKRARGREREESETSIRKRESEKKWRSSFERDDL